MFEYWNPKESSRRTRFTARLLNMKYEFRGKKLLDIGAFKGGLQDYLPSPTEYYPLDVHDLTKENPNAVQQDLNENTKLPFKNSYFDHVVFIGTIEHLFFPEKILSEINRVLRSKGTVLISFPNDNNYYMRFLHLINKYLDLPFDELKWMHHWYFGENSSETLLRKFFRIRNKYFYNGIYGRFVPFARSEIFYVAGKL